MGHVTRGRRTEDKETPRKRRAPGNRREVASLVGLLVTIAVLLVLLIALLPESVSDRRADAGAVSGESDAAPGERTDTADTTDPGASGEADPDVGTPEHPENAGDGGAAVSAGRDATGPDANEGGAVTEEYPEGEDRPLERTEEHGELWWLPDARTVPSERGALVLVLDDAGNTLDGLGHFLELPVPLAVAVLPQLDYSVQSAALAAAAGKEIMLHLPMEAENGANPGPGAIGTGLTSQQITAIVDENLASVPGTIGVNNHMGSLATAREELLRPVLAELHERGLFFLDSRTTAQTKGRLVAAEIGIPFAERSVFLDHDRTRESILASIRHALELSETGEPVFLIGHVTVPLLASILHEVYPVLDREGYRFAPVSRFVAPVRVAQAGDR